MSKTSNRHTGEADSRSKEKGSTEALPTSESTADDSTSERPLYHPLRFVDPVAGWHELAKPARLARDRRRKWGAR